jgi:SAM-dependent methyltransferase
MTVRQPSAAKADVLARYEVSSRAPEEHRRMMSSLDTWENRFDEAARMIPWRRVRRWLDVGCGTARFVEKVLAARIAPALDLCVGIDAIANNIATARAKAWPLHPDVLFHQWDIEDLDAFGYASFDLVTMVGVVYQCGLAPAVAVERSLGRLAESGVMLVTTENPRFSGFVADPHGCYPERQEFEEMFDCRPGRRVVRAQYTNPLWRERTSDVTDDESQAYKELFLLASFGAAAADGETAS